MKLICSLGHCECDGHTVHKLSQRRLIANWLDSRECDCSRMRGKVSSDWLPSDIKATRPVIDIFRMDGYFPDSPGSSRTPEGCKLLYNFVIYLPVCTASPLFIDSSVTTSKLSVPLLSYYTYTVCSVSISARPSVPPNFIAHKWFYDTYLRNTPLGGWRKQCCSSYFFSFSSSSCYFFPFLPLPLLPLLPILHLLLPRLPLPFLPLLPLLPPPLLLLLLLLLILLIIPFSFPSFFSSSFSSLFFIYSFLSSSFSSSSSSSFSSSSSSSSSFSSSSSSPSSSSSSSSMEAETKIHDRVPNRPKIYPHMEEINPIKMFKMSFNTHYNRLSFSHLLSCILRYPSL